MSAPDAIISVELTAKIDQLRDAFNVAIRETGNFDKKTQIALNNVDKAFANLATDVESSSTKVTRSLARAAMSSAQSGTAISKGAGNANAAIQELSRGIQDAPFGSIGYINNLQQFQSLFSGLVATTGSFTNAVKALGSSLTGAAGLGVLFSVVTAGIQIYSLWSQKANKDTKEVTKSLEEQRSEFAKSNYQKAATELTSLTQKIQLARQGFLDKTSVLKEYNDGIGKTIGRVTSLDEAEQNLVKNGDAYLKLIFLKANAEFAFQKAAEASYEAQKQQFEIDSNAPKISDRFKLDNPERGKKAVEENYIKPISELRDVAHQASKGLDGVSNSIQGINKNIGKEVNDKKQLDSLHKVTDKATDIAKSAQETMIKFAKENGFDLNALFGFDSKKSTRDFIVQYDEYAKNVAKVARQVTDKTKKSLEGKDKIEIPLPVSVYIDPSTLVESFTYMETQLLKFNDRASDIINNQLTDTFSGIGEALGDSLSGGGDIITNLTSTILGSLGALLTQLGKLAIATGVGIKAIKTALKTLNPVVAIGAGIALVALGSAISKSVAKLGDMPGYANGTNSARGGLALVGERGPEIVNLPTGSGVIPNHRIGNVISGGANVFIPEIRILGEDIWVSFKKTDKRLAGLG